MINIKHILKRFISVFYPSANREGNFIALTFHSVHPNYPYSIKPENFEFYIKYLKENFEMINLENFELIGKQIRKSYGVIIFDDGYEDNYFYAFPILKKYNVPATIAITTDFVFEGKDITRGWRFYKGLKPLTLPQIKKMINSGLIHIASHGKTHKKLAILSDDELKKEICSSKKILEENLSIEVSVFVYPFGQAKDFDLIRCINFLRECGYKRAFSNVWGRNDINLSNPFCLKRIEINYLDNRRDFINKIKGKWDFLKFYYKLKSLYEKDFNYKYNL